MLTRAQAEVLDFIAMHVRELGRWPSLGAIRSVMDLRSKGNVCDYLRRLEARGFIRRTGIGQYELLREWKPRERWFRFDDATKELREP